MISVIYSTREHNPQHTEHIKKRFSHPKVEVIEYVNNNQYSLTELYNKGLDEAKFDIVVFLHDDIVLETKNITNKILKHFDKNPEHGIIGVAGSRYMAESGKWWEKGEHMVGRVRHTAEDRTWLSEYSSYVGKELDNTVIVDGLFFAVHKQRIKECFDESVKGFHFYEVDFCFRNHLKDVKIGVCTDIMIMHKSVGATNDEWENSRAVFAEKFKGNLPASVNRKVHKDEQLKVLISCISFMQYTGSELYVFEVAKKLKKQGYDVSICSYLGSPLADSAHRLGIKLFALEEPPGYKMGDGVWGFNTPNGQVPSEKGKLYKVKDAKFDVIHCNHKPTTEYLLKLYPNNKFVTTIHSEVIELEEPILDDRIKKYIAIRPEIKDFLIDKFDIAEERIEVIYNPVDNERFKAYPIGGNSVKRVLFVGTLDYMRKTALIDLIETCGSEGKEVWIVGKENGVTVAELKASVNCSFDHVKYFPPTNNVENFIKQCDEVAGILLGRTTIEGWLCGRPAWIYDVDKQGTVLSKSFHEIPDDVNKFNSDVVMEQITELYNKVIG